jgi:HAMP domain-containing protein
VSRDSISSQQTLLLTQIALVFAGLVLITVGAIFIMVRRAMRPLRHLSETVDHISSGEDLDKPIKASSTDEVGRMARSLNRLRASLQAAMTRLGT